MWRLYTDCLFFPSSDYALQAGYPELLQLYSLNSGLRFVYLLDDGLDTQLQCGVDVSESLEQILEKNSYN